MDSGVFTPRSDVLTLRFGVVRETTGTGSLSRTAETSGKLVQPTQRGNSDSRTPSDGNIEEGLTGELEEVEEEPEDRSPEVQLVPESSRSCGTPETKQLLRKMLAMLEELRRRVA